MIIWLSSYPKNGNTWLRSLISSYYYTKDGLFLGDKQLQNIQQFPTKKFMENFDYDLKKPGDTVKYWIKAQEKINLDNKIKFFKTHNAFWKIGQDCFTNDENTKGIIHIVRDPRNVITSIKNHYNHESYEKALKFIKDEDNTIGVRGSKRGEDLPTIVSSWKFHYNSWKSITSFKSKYILIKYENLLNNPIDEFRKIAEFIKEIAPIKFDKKNILKAIENTSFENLKKQEDSRGFKEAPKNNNKFFHLGPKNNWRDLLDKSIKDEIEVSFKNEMKDLGYL